MRQAIAANHQSAPILTVHLRIFLSSPGDVAEERRLARDAIAELQREPQFEAARLEAVSWDDPHGRTPLVAQLDPQSAVERGLPKPSECDVVVGIFWARMGSPLPIEQHRKADGSAYRSGTEYELEDAFNANPGPDVLLYRRSEEPRWGARDPQLQEKQEQLARLDAYLAEFRAASRYIDAYPAQGELKERLKSDLRRVLAPRLKAAPIVGAFQDATPAAVGDARLAQAETRLADMPLDAVPAPAALPAGSHMPIARNALFVGRERDLKALAGALKAGETAAVGQLATVTGLGGIGKTQLTSEFVHRYGQYFLGGVFWLSFADPEVVPAEIATCGGPGGLNLRNDFGRLPLEVQVRLVAAEWQGPIPRLLVFDNCEDEALLARWRPHAGGCRVLVTSRRNTWSLHLGVREVSLGVLAREESLDLLRKHRPEVAPDDPMLDAIAEELGDLPLALHLAGSFLARYRHAPAGQPAAYLEAVRRPDLLEHRSLTIEGTSPTGHEQHVGRTFALSYEQLQAADATDQMALVTLARASCFMPGEAIPRALLRASEGIDAADEAGTLRFEDGIARLRELGLISEEGDGALILHRLLAAFVRSAAGESEAHRAEVEAAVFAWTARLNQAGYPAPLLAWQPQLRFVAERAAENDSEYAGALFNNLGQHLRMVAQFEAAKEAYVRALRIAEAHFGLDHPNVAAAANNLGLVLQDLEDLPSAKAALERALKIDRACFGRQHPNVATDVSNLGIVLHKLGDLMGAQAAFECALRIREAAFGPAHPEVATVVNNLGSVLQDRGDLAGARAAYERALEIDETSLGPDHPNVARDVNNLGSVLQALDQLEASKAAYERALRINEAALGADHPHVAKNVNNLGDVLHRLGDLESAKAAFERALTIDEASFGPHHPEVATDANNLGAVLQALGDTVGAKLAFERALAIDEASFGSDHANVARDINNLGSVLRAVGDLAGARAALERALAIFARVLGPDHPHTRTVRGNLDRLGDGSP